ncbi:MAG: glycosyl hydrolase 53 family protein [Eubacterium sp.]
MKNLRNVFKKMTALIVAFACVFSFQGNAGLYMVEEVRANDISVSNGEISNKGFESGFDEYWQITSNGAGSTSIDTQTYYDGTQSFKVSATGHYTTMLSQQISGLTPGYYCIQVYAITNGGHNACYIFGNGTTQGECMTSIPVSEEWRLITVRGIEVNSDGKLTLGMFIDTNDGCYVNIDSFTVTYENNQDKQYQSLFGGAISKLDWLEDEGAVYYDESGKEGDALQMMAENGCNFVRLEMYNNTGPRDSSSSGFSEGYFPAGYLDYDAMLKLGKRASDKEMDIQLSFMYADYWGNDYIPSDWAEAIDGITDESEIVDILTDCLYEYTKDCMQGFIDEGIIPAYVSLGNEMQGGILLPYGAYNKPEYMAQLLNAGYSAVKEVSPESQVVLHIAGGGDDVKWNGNGQGNWFFGLCNTYDISYDVIGASFYPYWAETLSVDDMVTWCNYMIDKFDKDVLIMESGYDFYDITAQGYTGQLENGGYYSDIYDFSPEGQRDFVIELINGIKSVKDGRCVGDLYWDPTFVYQEGVGTYIDASTDTASSNVISNTTFWDFDHVALPVMDAYRYNITGGNYGTLYGSVTTESGSVVANTEITLVIDTDTYTVTTDSYGTFYININKADSTVLKVCAEGYSSSAEYTDFSMDYGQRKNINIVLGEASDFTTADDDIVFHYYYAGTGTIYMVFDEPVLNDESYISYNGKYAYAMKSEGENWYSFDYRVSYENFIVVENLENELNEFSDYKNADLYLKLQKGYFTYFRYNHLYHDISTLENDYYIVGSTTEYDSSDPGIFSNYWAAGGKWLDKLKLDANGYYSIKLGIAEPEYTYAYCIYLGSSWDTKYMHGNRYFTVDEECYVTFILDPDKHTVTYEFTPVEPVLENGEGTEESPYLIYNADDLYEFAKIVNGTSDLHTQNTGAYAMLMNDITLNNQVLNEGQLISETNELNEWTPIGTSSNKFSGKFYGNNHVISGVYVNATGSYHGFFGATNTGSEISNLGLVDMYISGTSRNGGIVGHSVGTTIMNCYVQGYMYGTSTSLTYTAGIAGYISSVNISDCYVTGTITGKKYIGAIAGNSNVSSSITNCYYLTDSASGGINSSDIDGSAEALNATAFNNGEAAWKLGNDVFAQTIGKDNYPVFIESDRSNAVYRIQLYDIDDITEDISSSGPQKILYGNPGECLYNLELSKDNYEFVDWYTDEEMINVVESADILTEDIDLYARYISNEVLSVKAQTIEGTNAESELTSIRFVTMIDDLDYVNVGFVIDYTYVQSNHRVTKSTRAYSAIKAGGILVYPSDFNSESAYFVTYVIRNIPNVAFDVDFEVTPYITTESGRIIYGTQRTISVQDFFEQYETFN